MLLTFKALHGEGPEYIKELLNTYTPRRTLRNSNDLCLVVPEYHYVETRKRAFGIRAPLEWNELPYDLRNKDSAGSFKIALKTFLYRQVYD